MFFLVLSFSLHGCVACLEQLFHSTDIISGYGSSSSVHFIDWTQTPDISSTSEVDKMKNIPELVKPHQENVAKRKLDSAEEVESFEVLYAEEAQDPENLSKKAKRSTEDEELKSGTENTKWELISQAEANELFISPVRCSEVEEPTDYSWFTPDNLPVDGKESCKPDNKFPEQDETKLDLVRKVFLGTTEVPLGLEWDVIRDEIEASKNVQHVLADQGVKDTAEEYWDLQKEEIAGVDNVSSSYQMGNIEIPLILTEPQNVEQSPIEFPRDEFAPAETKQAVLIPPIIAHCDSHVKNKSAVTNVDLSKFEDPPENLTRADHDGSELPEIRTIDSAHLVAEVEDSKFLAVRTRLIEHEIPAEKEIHFEPAVLQLQELGTRITDEIQETHEHLTVLTAVDELNETVQSASVDNLELLSTDTPLTVFLEQPESEKSTEAQIFPSVTDVNALTIEVPDKLYDLYPDSLERKPEESTVPKQSDIEEEPTLNVPAFFVLETVEKFDLGEDKPLETEGVSAELMPKLDNSDPKSVAEVELLNQKVDQSVEEPVVEQNLDGIAVVSPAAVEPVIEPTEKENDTTLSAISAFVNQETSEPFDEITLDGAKPEEQQTPYYNTVQANVRSGDKSIFQTSVSQACLPHLSLEETKVFGKPSKDDPELRVGQVERDYFNEPYINEAPDMEREPLDEDYRSSELLKPVLVNEVESENDSKKLIEELGEPDPTVSVNRYPVPKLLKYNEIVPSEEFHIEVGCLDWPKLSDLEQQETSGVKEVASEEVLDDFPSESLSNLPVDNASELPQENFSALKLEILDDENLNTTELSLEVSEVPPPEMDSSEQMDDNDEVNVEVMGEPPSVSEESTSDQPTSHVEPSFANANNQTLTNFENEHALTAETEKALQSDSDEKPGESVAEQFFSDDTANSKTDEVINMYDLGTETARSVSQTQDYLDQTIALDPLQHAQSVEPAYPLEDLYQPVVEQNTGKN